MQGMPLTITTISTAENKSAMEIAMNGNVMQKIIFDGEKGAMIQGGKATPFEKDKNKVTAEETSMFPEANYLKENYTIELKGMDIQNDEDVYVVTITKPSDIVMTNYYSVTSGFLILSQEANEEGMSESLYSDYREVNKIKVPHLILRNFGPQKMELKVEKIELNPEVELETFMF
jgi:zinc protease